MKIVFVVVGKTVEKEVTALVDKYLNRIRRCEVSFKVVSNIKNRLPQEEQKLNECRQILKHIGRDDFVVLLDDKGKEFDSVSFANWLGKREMVVRTMVFVVGGAYGFSQEMYDRADFQLSLSKMTFSHQIIRAIFAEQLYRAFSIIEGLPYHHE